MAIFRGKQRDELKGSLMNYIIHCNEEIDTDVLVDKINNSLPLKEQIKTSESFTSSVNILVTTGAGNTIQGVQNLDKSFLNIVINCKKKLEIVS